MCVVILYPNLIAYCCLVAHTALENWEVATKGIKLCLSCSVKNCGPVYSGIWTIMASGNVSFVLIKG